MCFLAYINLSVLGIEQQGSHSETPQKSNALIKAIQLVEALPSFSGAPILKLFATLRSQEEIRIIPQNKSLFLQFSLWTFLPKVVTI